MGKFFAVMPAAVIAMLAISLFECVLILPAHLGHDVSRGESFTKWLFTPIQPLLWLVEKANQGASRCLKFVIERIYTPSLDFSEISIDSTQCSHSLVGDYPRGGGTRGDSLCLLPQDG